MGRYRIALTCLALVACMGEPERATMLPLPPAADMAASLGELRVLSYNVKGLPWPIAFDRDAALDAIGLQLAAMRKAGSHPQVVVLQEAFVDEAKRIGRIAGYRHAAFGAGPGAAATPAAPPIGDGYARRASWLKGETFSPVLDSGLALFSDYPIERVERLTFPQGACAGYDCLAAKGVLIAWIRLPGRVAPLAVATTHLNSRDSSGVPAGRSGEAFAWQLGRVQAFARAQIGGDQAAIFAGDFNFGGDSERIAAARRIGTPLAGGSEAVHDALTSNEVAEPSRAEARAIFGKRTDQLFYRSGHALALAPTALEIPFPATGTERPLSDHPGLMVRYALNAASDPGKRT